MSGHRLKLTNDDGLCWEFTCDEPEGALCRLVCHDGCETWFEDHDQVHDHKLQPSFCTFVENMEAVDPEHEAIGDCTLFEGPVEIEYEDGYRWYPVTADIGERK